MKRILAILLIWGFLLFPAQEAKLKKLNAEISKIAEKINALNKESGSLLNELYRIELNYKKAVSENNRINHLLSVTQSTIKQKEREKSQLENKIERSKTGIKNALRILNKIGKAGNFKIFSNIKDIDQLFRNYYLFLSLINRKIDEIGRIRIYLKELRKIRSELEKEMNKLNALKISQQKKIKEILDAKNAKSRFIDQVNSDRKKHLDMLEELKSEAKRLTNLVKENINVFDLPELNLNNLKGNLIWPLKGSVISKFGRKKSTRFNTYILSNGIDIKPVGSMKIKAVFEGVIIFMDYFKGYGDIIIVQHSKDLLSVYGHCGEFLKKRGDYVLAGEEIGIVGDSGSTSGKTLYFEVRRETVAEDPLFWLKPGGNH